MKIKRTQLIISDQLMRLRQLQALDSVAGSWKNAAHPELKRGSIQWVKKFSQE
jgi:hypothetical protein